MSLTMLLVTFAIALAFVLITIIKFKMHPFLSLLLGGLLMGIIAGIPLNKIPGTLASGFGNTMTGIGIIIVLGVILGELLHQSGCMDEIAAMLLRATGEKRAPLAINLTGFIVSIPVFFDAAFIILVNLVKQLSRKGKIPFITLVTALAMGLITTHALVIPTPGPLTVAGNLGLDFGWFFLYSFIVALVASLVAGVLYAKGIGKLGGNATDFASKFDDEVVEAPAANKNAPSGQLGVFLIFLPIVLILLGSVMTNVLANKESFIYSLFAFIGDKNIALLVGVIVAFICLKKYIKTPFTEVIAKSGEQAGAIFIITGAGGAFGAVINATGIGTQLSTAMAGWTGANVGVILVIACWVISQVLRAAQGSTTVALVTTSAMMAPVLAGLAPGTVSPILIGLAICAGGIGVSLPNDSGFWVVNRFSRFSVKQTFQAWTIGGTISGVTALLVIIVLSFFTNVLPGLLPAVSAIVP